MTARAVALVPVALALIFALVMAPRSVAAETSPRGKVTRIGVLSGASPEWLAPMLEAFRQELQRSGYGEGKVILEVRHGRGRDEILPQLAAELVRLNVDVIVTASSTPATLAAKQATTTIPIVMVAAGAPVDTGLVASLARPGGNITGSTTLGAEIASKRLQLVKEVLPNATQVALLWNPDNPANARLERELQETAPRAGLKLMSITVRRADEFEGAFARTAKQHPAALILTGDPMHQTHIGQIIDFAARTRVPAFYNIKDNALAGGFVSYGPDYQELYRRAAMYVTRILSGAKPGDLPVEQPTKFELIINLKTAKALGLMVPPSLLLRADQVIQ